VYNELLGPIRRELDRQIFFLKNISLLPFSPRGEMMKEYAKLIKTLGKGESACMVYCRFNHDVIGSSNLRDIKEYCQRYNLTYLTTVDFLFFAIQRKLMTKDEAVQFISEVRRKDSKLPDVDFDTFVSKVFL
jgi:predicted nucleic acid-binding protein